MSQVPWNVPPPAVRAKNVILPNGPWLFLSLMDEHGGRCAGQVMTAVGTDAPNVAGLVYIAA
jgi:hypothetical protein